MYKEIKILLFIFISLLICSPNYLFAAKAYLSPSSGSFEVGDIVDVDILIDTQGEEINAISLDLSFPPEKMQLVSPSVGKSIVSVWINQPEFNNNAGVVSLEGGIPGGVLSQKGVVASLKFRIKESGQATLRFLNSSAVLLNDGLGTNVLTETGNTSFTFRLPAPEGPIVYSESHPDQETWYSHSGVILSWNSGRDGYSYMLSREALGVPDNISEGANISISYRDIEDGTHYFHIKSLYRGAWGGTTHYALNVDKTPPAEFDIEILPSAYTKSRNPIISFVTSDALSGLDRYEIKVIPLFKTEEGDEGLFTEATSPYVYKVSSEGSYDVVVRAYDNAGNIREVTKRMIISDRFLDISMEDGFFIGGGMIAWSWIYGLLVLILVIISFGAYMPDKTYQKIMNWLKPNKKDEKDIKKKLEELQRYRNRYGHLAIIFGFIISLFGVNPVMANERGVLSPPQVEIMPSHISETELFYVGGFTSIPNVEVVIYLQNLESGEIYNFQTPSNEKREWFYRHTDFLSSGNYALWSQSVNGEEMSPPSSQTELTVTKNALVFGGSRLSYGALYGIIFIILLIIILILAGYLVRRLKEEHAKGYALRKEAEEAEEALRFGFALLKKDIERELSYLALKDGDYSEDERQRKEQLLSDLEDIKSKIGKEIQDINQVSI